MQSPTDYNRMVAERIRTARMDAALTQDELADMLYIDRSTVSKWERALTKIGADEMMAVADALGITVDELLGVPGSSAAPRGRFDLMPLVRQAVRECVERGQGDALVDGATNVTEKPTAMIHREAKGFSPRWEGVGHGQPAGADMPDRAASLWERIACVLEDAGIYGVRDIECQCGASHVKFDFFVDSDTRNRFAGGRSMYDLEDYIERVSGVPRLLIEPPSLYDGHMSIEATMPDDLLLPVPFSCLSDFAAGEPHESPVATCIGMGPDGHMVQVDLSDGPHWLVCGQTGSGKTVAMHSLLLGCMMHADPSELRVTWIDPKKVEATPYKGSPFCPIDPVHDLGDAYGVVAYFAWEMYHRYEVFRRAQVRDIGEYNAWAATNPDKAKELGGSEKIPYWILAIDEYADFSETGGHELEEIVKKIGAMGRGAGIILLIATQRPSAESISSTLKSNIPSRVALRVTSAINSDIILDHDGAEKLRGKGDAIIKFGDATAEIRVQFPLVTHDDLVEQLDGFRERFGEAYARGEYFSAFEREHLVDMSSSRRSRWHGRVVDDYVHGPDGQLLYTRDGYPVVRKDDATGEDIEERWHSTPFDVLSLGSQGKPADLRIDFKTVVTDSTLAREIHLKDRLCDWAEDASPDMVPDGSWTDDWHVVVHRRRLGRF